MSDTISQKEYLKKYLGKKPGEKKKKKKKDPNSGNRITIIDDNIDLDLSRNKQEDDEDAPQIVAIIDERPPSLRFDEQTKDALWKPIGASNNNDAAHYPLLKSSFKVAKIESTTFKSLNRELPPPRKIIKPQLKLKTTKDVDNSPPRRRSVNEDVSTRKSSEEDYSPPRLHKVNEDNSPPRRRRPSPDNSPPRKEAQNQDNSLPRKGRPIEDNSPPRKEAQNQDNSLPRKRRPIEDNSPPRRRRRQSQDNSPPRRRRQSESNSPPRKRRPSEDNSQPRRRSSGDNSPPRKRKVIQDCSPPISTKFSSTRSNNFSPSRKHQRYVSPGASYRNRDNKSPHRKQSRWEKNERSPTGKFKGETNDRSPTRSDRTEKTLGGKAAGLKNAEELMQETQQLQERENEMFSNMSHQMSGQNADTIVRDRKTGRIRNLDEEAEDQRNKHEEDEKNKEKYSRWGRGLAQIESREQKLKDELHEMSKPLARYADDADLEKYLKEQEREGDPMLAYIRKKKRKEAAKCGIVEKPQFEGQFMPNRYGIRPGHRWDGVDRSNGYEKKWFEVQNEKRALQEDSYKWSTEDM